MTDSINVLYLTGNPNRASTTVPTEGWFRTLRARGLRPVVVSDRCGAFHSWVEQEGIPAYQVSMAWPRMTAPWAFLRSLYRLRCVVRSHKIQLIHSNEHDVYPIASYLSRWCGIPVVASVHCRLDRPFSEWAFGKGRQPRRLFFISRGSMEACRPSVVGIVRESDWRLLYNGLDLRSFVPDQALRERFRSDLGVGSEILIGVGCALRPGKQLEHLVEAASRVRTTGFKVVIAGASVKGTEQYAARLLQEARSKLGERFLYLGHLQELRGLYNALDLVVNTSKTEACSISILEALACGCPVVGYPSGSVDEQVLPGGGEIVAQDRVDELSAAIERWLGDRINLSASRAGARRRCESSFDIRDLADLLWNEYLDLISQVSRKGQIERVRLPESI